MKLYYFFIACAVNKQHNAGRTVLFLLHLKKRKQCKKDTFSERSERGRSPNTHTGMRKVSGDIITRFPPILYAQSLRARLLKVFAF
jgi:hypothetical protein